jgi:hypothetical protein
MEALGVFVFIVWVLAAFGWASLRWGVDSRDLEPFGHR